MFGGQCGSDKHVLKSFKATVVRFSKSNYRMPGYGKILDKVY